MCVDFEFTNNTELPSENISQLQRGGQEEPRGAKRSEEEPGGAIKPPRAGNQNDEASNRVILPLHHARTLNHTTILLTRSTLIVSDIVPIITFKGLGSSLYLTLFLALFLPTEKKPGAWRTQEELLLVPPVPSLLLLHPPGFSLLLLAPPRCSWLFLDPPGCQENPEEPGTASPSFLWLPFLKKKRYPILMLSLSPLH